MDGVSLVLFFARLPEEVMSHDFFNSQSHIFLKKKIFALPPQIKQQTSFT